MALASRRKIGAGSTKRPRAARAARRRRWWPTHDLLVSDAANDTAAEFVRGKIRGIVKNPKTAELLTPTDHPLGAKRICVDTDYYNTYNRDNVTLVDLRKAPDRGNYGMGLRTEDAHYELDSLIFATGFDAMTGALLAIDIRGRGGMRLQDKWADGPRTYLGLMVEGFPNLFIGHRARAARPCSAMSCLDRAACRVDRAVHRASAHARLSQHRGHARRRRQVGRACERGGRYALSRRQIPGTRARIFRGSHAIFMPYVGGVGVYRQICNEVASKGYEGFVLTARDKAHARRRRMNEAAAFERNATAKLMASWKC